jgi:hypothetical protein
VAAKSEFVKRKKKLSAVSHRLSANSLLKAADS